MSVFKPQIKILDKKTSELGLRFLWLGLTMFLLVPTMKTLIPIHISIPAF